MTIFSRGCLVAVVAVVVEGRHGCDNDTWNELFCQDVRLAGVMSFLERGLNTGVLKEEER